MPLFGLIGKSLQHSFSKKYFEEKFLIEKIQDCMYELFELEDITAFKKLIADYREELQGLNVTIPYKESIIDYLDEIDYEAHQVGAVNCIAFSKDHSTKGYNTDVYGFEQSLLPLLPDPDKTTALVFGNGGAAKAVAYVLHKNKIPFTLVHRNGKTGFFEKFSSLQSCITWDALRKETFQQHSLLINTTPVGMYPHIDQLLTPLIAEVTSDHIVYDLIYNPEQTPFLKIAAQRGATIKNGAEMLHLQAEKSWEIWNGYF